MSPRPRTVDDGQIAMALGRVISRLGPSKLTLAAIAREAGLSPATLVQRFGSKRNLLVKLSPGAGDSAPLVAKLRAEGRPPLAIAREVVLCLADLAPSPQALINSFSAYLEIDLADPVLRRFVVESGIRNEALVAGLLREAHDAGAIDCPNPEGLARALFGLGSGSLLSWATSREGTARAWVERDVDAVLAPLLRGRQGRTAAKKTVGRPSGRSPSGRT